MIVTISFYSVGDLHVLSIQIPFVFGYDSFLDDRYNRYETSVQTTLKRHKNIHAIHYPLFSVGQSSDYEGRLRHFQHSIPYYTEAEVILAGYHSLRIGLNVGEMLDFLLGWTTIDIFDDDLAKKDRDGDEEPESATGE